MHVGCLGRPLRPPRWASRRTRWRNLIRASELSAVLIAVLVAGDVGVDHLLRFPPDAYTTGPGPEGVAMVSPTAVSTSPAGTAQPSPATYDYPRPVDGCAAADNGVGAGSCLSTVTAPSTAFSRRPMPKLKRARARTRSTSMSHRQILAAGPANGSAREDATAGKH